MPDTQNIATMPGPVHSAFRGLEYYTEKNAPFFFGRDDEIKELYRLVKYNTLTLVFGKSGTGKTSLLYAGAFPQLRNDDCLPFRIRLVFNKESPTLLTQVWNEIKENVVTYQFRIEKYVEGETLWEFFHREDLWKVVTPILLFDQFEEIFTIASKYPGRKEELECLLVELSDLIENIVPAKVKTRYLQENRRIEYDYKKQRVKVIFAFREDFLVDMESITSRIPSVKNARFRLMPMNGGKAYEVITKTWKTAIDEAGADKIIGYLVNDPEDENNLQKLHSRFDLLEIEPSLLSQVCFSLDKKRIDEGRDRVSADFLAKNSKEITLGSIYDKALIDSITAQDAGINEKALIAAEQKAKKFIEDNLVNENGFREKYVENEIPHGLLQTIDGLKARFFIRQDGIFIELTHDVIAAVIRKGRDVRMKQEARRAAIKKALFIAAIAALISTAGLAISGFYVKKSVDEITANKKTIASQKEWIESHKQSKPKPGTLPLAKGSGKDTANFSDSAIHNRDSLIQQLQTQLNDLQTLVILYKDTVYLRDQELVEKKKSLDDLSTNNQDLKIQITGLQEQNTGFKIKINGLNTEVKRLQGLSLDTSYFTIYQTHLDGLLMYIDTCPVELRQRINALEINWLPFREKTQQKKNNN